jgi:hypothetical protein
MYANKKVKKFPNKPHCSDEEPDKWLLEDRVVVKGLPTKGTEGNLGTMMIYSTVYMHQN